jgi:hypothetical protein
MPGYYQTWENPGIAGSQEGAKTKIEDPPHPEKNLEIYAKCNHTQRHGKNTFNNHTNENGPPFFEGAV